jgi:uncharacterized membrane protein YoaK (UPF0700 family)
MTAQQPPARIPLWARFTRDPADGPLPALLLLLTTMTGVIDAVSILGLGRVFVANMTGNVVFIGFGIARAPGFSLVASTAALVGFLAGAFAGGALVGRFGAHRGLLLRNACSVQFALVLIALIITVPLPAEPATAARAVVAALCAIAMGVQNTTARRLAVPDLTTTVLTMTLTGIAADFRTRPETVTRRALSVLTMFVGAIGGALLVLHTRLIWGLVVASTLLGVVAVGSSLASARPAGWQTPTA